MKQLSLLRHAKSGWDDASLPDHERVLNKRGRVAAPRMGRLIKTEGLIPELIVSSTAARAMQTAEAVVRESGFSGPVRRESELYLADVPTHLRLLRKLPETYGHVMVVGHNPGLEQLITALTGRDEKMPTGALAVLSLDIDAWRKLPDPPEARLERVYRPKELE